MANIGKEFFPTRATESVTLNPRDVTAAVRLLRILLQDAEPSQLDGMPSTNLSRSVDVESDATSRLARRLLQSRRRRSTHFPPAMFGEPAWDVVLALFLGHASERRHTVSSLADNVGTPLTTTLRWLDYLEQAKLVHRQPSPTDKRVTFVELTVVGKEKMTVYLEEMIKGPVTI